MTAQDTIPAPAPVLLTEIHHVPALGGQIWPVAVTIGQPAGFTLWGGCSNKGWKTAGGALGWIKRFASNNGGTACWAIVMETYRGATSYNVAIGTVDALKEGVRTSSTHARESLCALVSPSKA